MQRYIFFAGIGRNMKKMLYLCTAFEGHNMAIES